MIQTRKLSLIQHLAILCCVFLFAANANADQPWATSVDGRLFQTGTANPLRDSSLSFTLQILNPSKDCVLYEETQVYDTNVTNGYFSLKVGSAAPDLSGRRTSNDPGYTMSRVFNNTLNSFPAAAGCAGGYSPADGDARYLRVSIDPTSGASEVLSPDIALNSVPSAKVAETVGGLSRAELLQVNTAGVNRLDQNNLQAVFNTTQLPILTALLGGTSSLYMRQGANGAATLPGVSGNAPSASAGQIWYDTATNTMKYQSNSGPQTLGVAGAGITGVTAGTGLNVGAGPGGTISTSGTLNIDVGSGVGQIVQVQAGGKLPAVSGADLTNLNGSAMNSGTIGGTTAVNTTGTIQSGAITSSGAVTAASLTTTGSVSSSDVRTNSVKIYKPSTLLNVELVADAALSSSLVFTLPTTLGSNGQVLQVDNAGKMSWTTISGTVPGGSAGGDLGGNYPNPDVVKIRGNAVASGSLAVGDTGKVYRWSGTQFEAVNFGVDDLKTEAGLSQFATNCGSDQTLTWSVITDAFACTPIAINANQITAGTLDSARLPIVGVDKGGTGLSALGTSNQVLGVNAAGNAAEYKSIVAGSGVSVTPSAGTITITATGSGGTVTSVSGNGPISVATGTTTPSISISQANATTDGYLSFADWNLFNSKQTAGNYITALTGDVVAAGPGAATATIQANAITTSKINDGAVTVNKLGALAVTDAKINDVTWGKITGTPTSLTGYGITDSLVANGGGVPSISAAIEASRPAAGTAGRLFVATDTHRVFRDTGATWEQMSVNASDLASGTLPAGRLPALTGDVTSSAGSNSVTLNTVPLGKGGTGLSAGGSSNQVLGMNNSGTAAEYKSIVAGSGVTVTPTAGVLTITATGTGGTVTNITAGTGLNVGAGPGGSITGTGTLNIDVGTTTGQIVQVAASNRLPAIDATNLTNLNANNLASGTLPSGRLPAFTGDVTSSAGSTTLTLGTVPINKGGTGQVTANAALNALLPSQTSASGRVLQSNGTDASWVIPNAGTVTSVTGSGPISVATGTTTPAISMTQANTTTAGFLSSTDWNTFNNKASTASLSNYVLKAGDTMTGALDVGGLLRAAGSGAVPTSGSGVEISLVSGIGHVGAIDRTTPAFLPLLNFGSNIRFNTGPSSLEAMRIIESGNVGIGTTAPNRQLEVASNAPHLRLNDLDGTGASANTFMEFGGSSGGSWGRTGWVGDGNAVEQAISLFGDTGSDLRLGANGIETIRILSSNTNVGIGTASPSEKLEVVGKIKGTELCIGTDCRSAWPTGAGGSVTNVTSANADIGITAGTTVPVLTLNSGTGANQILKLNGSSEIPAVSGVNLTNLNASNLASGTLPTARLPAFTGDVTSTAGSNSITLNTVPVSKGGTASTTFTANQMIVANGTGTALQSFSCTAGYVLKFNASGVAACDTIAGVLGYTPANAANYVAKAGDTMTGALVLPSNGLTVGTNQLVVSGSNVGVGTASPTSKLQVDGGIQIGSDAATCDSTKAGTLRYASSRMEYCNGSAWSVMNAGATQAPAFYVHKNAVNQTVTAMTYAKLTWNTELFDTNNNFTSDRFTPTVAGRYLVALNIYCPDSPQYCHPVIFKNGVQYTGTVGGNGGNVGHNISTVVDMNGTTDYIEAYAFNYGSTVSGVPGWTSFSGSLLNGSTIASTGSGTTNYVPMWSNATALGNSPMAVSGSNVGIGTASPQEKLDVAGDIKFGNWGFLTSYSSNNQQLRHNVNSANTVVDSTVPSRTFVMGDGNDSFAFYRAPATAGVPAWVKQMSIDASSNLTVVGTVKAPQIEATKAGYVRVLLNHCSGPCASYHGLNTWANVSGLNHSKVTNDTATFTVAGASGSVTINKQGTYRIRISSMVMFTSGGTHQYSCPFINGTANCSGGSSTDQVPHKVTPAGSWSTGIHESLLDLGPGTVVNYGYLTNVPLDYWAHDGYTSMEILRLN